MIELKTLCGKIAMPEEVTEKVIAAAENMDFSLLKKSVEKFRSRESRMDGVKELQTKLGEDPLGFKMLACMLTAAEFTYDKYTEKQIDEKIFFDTFA
ncbi:MAG TPA: acyltransferase domain-containing protein [Caproicibacter sp.]|nr:acyltransferase domain-containing protein [Caproicibacter sp.]